MLRILLLTVKLAVIALVLFMQSFETNAAWGSFDTSFGFQGATIDTITGYHPRSVAIQPDGKILITGYRTTQLSGDRFFLRRYLSNGQLDTAFGTNGAAIGPETNTISTDYRGDTIVVQANGKIAVSGSANGNYSVWQFNMNGVKDTTFGANGLAVLTNYRVMSAWYPEMNIQSGKLLLSIRKQVGSDQRIVLVRLTSIGTIDTHFGSSGESLTGIYGGDKGSGTVVEADGKITIGGIKFDNLNAKGLERKLASGQDDLTFTPPTNFSFGIIGSGLVEMANGKYAMRWGNLAGNGSVTVVLDKVSPAGIFEGSLSPYNGFQSTGCPEIFTSQTDGKLIVQFTGLLFRTNDELDAGSIETNYCSNLSGITSMARAALQPDDKMVVAGVYNNYLILVRLLPN